VGSISAWGVFQLALHVSVAPWLTARASLYWLACGISFFLASQVAGAGSRRRVFLTWLLWGATALSVVALLERYQGIVPIGPGVVGTFLYKNHFAAVIEMVAPIALWRGLADSGNRFAAGVMFAVLFAGMVVSASRTGVILLLAELLIALAVMLSRRALRPKTAFSLAAVSVVVLGSAASIAGPERIWEHFHEKNPWSVRRQLLASTIRMARDRPWLGYGMGTWRTVYPGFATFDTGLLANEAHNDWAEWTAEAGVPFTILMALLVLGLAKPAVRSIWGLGVLMAMVHSLVDYPIREPATGLLWFALAGALSCYGNEQKVRDLAHCRRADRSRQAAVVR